MKILFITNLLPYPLDNGGKIKTYNSIDILSKNNDIDLIAFYENEKDLIYEKEMRKICSNVTLFNKKITTGNNIYYMLKIAIKGLLSKTPFVCYKFKDKDVMNYLEKILENNKYDYIYIDHLQLAVYMNLLKRFNIDIVLDQHNCESVIIHRKYEVEKSLIKKIFLYYEYIRLKKFEAEVIDNVFKILVLSENDKSEMMKLSRKKEDNKFLKIPIPMKIDYKKNISEKIEKEKIKMLFLGTMSWAPNSMGIEWFVKNVIPLLEKNEYIKYKLYIVGKDPGDKLLEMCRKYKNIEVTGFVENVNKYIEECDFMIVPLFIGSGMRVKILEAMGKGIPVISTSIGAEGIQVTDKKNILIANDEKEFIDCISLITNNEVYMRLHKESIKLFEENYSVECLQGKFKEVFK